MTRLSKPVYTGDSVARTKEFSEFHDIVKPFGNSGHVTTPKNWVGKKVRVMLVEKEE